MKLATAFTFLVATLVLLFALYMHDSAHRYDVVLAAAGSGGSQTDAGSTETVGYLVDHKTGKVWMLRNGARVPTILLPCLTGKETERGCEQAVEAPKKP